MTKEFIAHLGVGWDDNPPGIGSGRYPHGSGENPNQHDDSLEARVKKLKKDGIKDSENIILIGYSVRGSKTKRREI